MKHWLVAINTTTSGVIDAVAKVLTDQYSDRYSGEMVIREDDARYLGVLVAELLVTLPGVEK
jgi:hypothetical protein